MTPEEKRGSVEELAQALATTPVRMASILGRLGIEVDEDGRFDAAAALVAIESVSKVSPLADVSKFLAAAEMGADEESCRRFLKANLELNGLAVVGRAKRRGARMTVRRRDGSEFYLMTYVALLEKANGQIGFTVNYMADPHLDWIALIAKPWGRMFLKRRTEILSSMRIQPGDEPKTANVTLSRSTATDLFEDRVAELLTR